MDNNQYFKKFAQWVNSDDREPCDVDCFAEIKSGVLRAVYQQDRNELKELHLWMTPLAARLSRRLKQDRLPPAVKQSVEAPLLAALVRGVLHIMEKDDPLRAVELIRHGAEVLSILLQKDGNIRLDDFRDLWPGKAAPPSVSTISRALSALEEAGFVQRSGATKGRLYLVLTKAEKWWKTHEIQDGRAPAQSSLPTTRSSLADQAGSTNELLKGAAPEIVADEHIPVYYRQVSSQTGDTFQQMVSGRPQ